MFLTLTHKFIGALLLAVTTCCTAVFAISIFSMQAPLDDRLDDDIHRMQHIIDASNEVTFKRLEQIAALLAQNEELINAVKLFDHEQTSRMAAQAMQITSSDLITISDEHGMVIGRGHSKRWNDSIINQETVASALNNHPSTGIVFGTEMPFSLRATHPVVSDGKIVGTLSIGVDLAAPGYVDWLKSLSGMEIGIFKQDTCIMATAIKDGKRPLNEKLSPTELTKEVLQEGKTCFLDHNIFGIEYKAAYWPLRTADGKIAGLWFAGTPLNQLMKLEKEAITQSINLSVILLVVML
ncbi:MAG: cache domain-containing protein, partial [Desulfovibrionaceae bacterium]|nr:cache domain-containing protein [Desulfovibrionaceae bacterium]